MGVVKHPTPAELQDVARDLGMRLTDADLASYLELMTITRILDAGGTITGKVHCECFCFSGGSHTGAHGAVHNPLKRGYSAGGSSSGSAAVVANREVDMAIGGDQGGSIRLPAGLMLVGKQFDEMALYKLASAWESGADWKSIRP
jgi:Asp-tRNA(Asn)/Glu-tRNA(Gln) amidotransferase A subunit family amidase